MKTNRVIAGDVYDKLPELPDESIHMVMTSPPYWNLRDYGEDGQLGLEKTPEEFVENLADVFDEVKRVLRPDGSLWLNLGDTYHNKDLQQIPARVALELQKRGWILRNRVTWAKPNPMPQSVKDRLNDTTEAVFHFVKNPEYWYDLDAIREPHEHYEDFVNADKQPERKKSEVKGVADMTNHEAGGRSRNEVAESMNPAGKNPGDVFEVTTKPFPDAHFAVYPPELCEKPIKATCPPDGVVLDPFAGAGTTLLKAKELGREFVGIELNPEYADMARARVGLDVVNPENIRGDANQSGFESYE
jgi:site-specific DNA-methyltransferase (adenine-specific)